MSGGPVLRNSKWKKRHASKNKTPRANHFFAVQISDCQVSIKIQKHMSSLSVVVTFQFLADRGSSPQRSQDHIGAGTRVEQRPGVSINSPHHAGSCTPVQPRGFGQVIYVCYTAGGSNQQLSICLWQGPIRFWRKRWESSRLPGSKLNSWTSTWHRLATLTTKSSTPVWKKKVKAQSTWIIFPNRYVNVAKRPASR
jgi:hypothetical protein